MTADEALVATAIATAIAAAAAVASALFALFAVRAQRAAMGPRVRVQVETLMPVFGMSGRSFAGSSLGDPWFAIAILNAGVIPVIVTSAGIDFGDGNHGPFVGQPWPGLEGLPKRLDAGESITLYTDQLKKIAQAHVEHVGAKAATASCSGRAFKSKPISQSWLDGWAK